MATPNPISQLGGAPLIETASTAVVQLTEQSGTKLLSRAALKKKVAGRVGRFFADGLKHAVANRAIVELACGTSKYYLHRDVAAEHFGFEDPAAPTALASPIQPKPPTLEDLVPVYRRLKAEQGGFSAVKIFDLMKASKVPKEDLHRLLIAETRAERVTIHHTTSAELPAEVVDAAIRLPGYAEPFVTVIIKDDQ